MSLLPSSVQPTLCLEPLSAWLERRLPARQCARGHQPPPPAAIEQLLPKIARGGDEEILRAVEEADARGGLLLAAAPTASWRLGAAERPDRLARPAHNYEEEEDGCATHPPNAQARRESACRAQLFKIAARGNLIVVDRFSTEMRCPRVLYCTPSVRRPPDVPGGSFRRNFRKFRGTTVLPSTPRRPPFAPVAGTTLQTAVLGASPLANIR